MNRSEVLSRIHNEASLVVQEWDRTMCMNLLPEQREDAFIRFGSDVEYCCDIRSKLKRAQTDFDFGPWLDSLILLREEVVTYLASLRPTEGKR